MATVTLVSFGYLHGPAPDAHTTFDVRAHYRDPHRDAILRELTALDPRVQQAVANTIGIPDLIDALTATARAYLSGPVPAPLTIAIGCAGGRHRSAYLATEVGHRLCQLGIDTDVQHRDIEKPVVHRATKQTTGQ